MQRDPKKRYNSIDSPRQASSGQGMENYNIYDEIGRGQHSNVYKARRKRSIEYVAVKSTAKDRMAKILNEVQFLHKFNSPYVLKFHNWYESTNHIWIIFEFCIGGDLLNLITQDKTLPEESVRAHQPTPPNNEVDMLQLDEPRHHVAKLPPKTAPVQSKRRGPKPSKSSLHALKHAKARIFTTLDGSVKPVVACTAIESVAVPRIKESMLPFPIVPVESLTTQKDIEAKLEQLYDYLRSNDATVAEKHNALAYLYAMATSSKFANIIVNSSLMTLLGKLLEQSTSSALSSRLGLVLGYVVRFATFIAPDVVSDSTPGAILPILIQTLQVEHDNVQVTRRVMACVGELAFYTITQAPTRPLNPPTVQCLVRGIQDVDAIVRHYAVQTLCNILTHATDSDVVAPFVTPAVAYALMDRSLREPATQQPLQVAAIQTMAQVLKHASAPSLEGSNVVDTIFLHVARNMSIAWDHLWLAQRDYRWMIAALNVLNATLQHTAQDLSTDIPKGEFMSTICNLRSLETLGHALESREFEEDESGHIHATGRFKDGDVKLTNLVHGKLLLFLYFGLQASREFAVLFVQSNLLKVVDALLVHDAAPSSATSIYALQSAQQVVALSSRIALEVTMSLGDDRVALDVLPLFDGLVSQLLHHPQCRQVFVGILLDNVNQENECFAVGLANAIQATTEAAVKILLLVFSKHDIVSDADMANQIWFQTALFQLAAVLTSTGVTSSDVVADAIRVVNCALDVFSPAPYVDEYIVHHLLPTFHVLLHASTNDRVRRCAVEFLYNVVHHDVAFVSILYRLNLIDPILHLLVHTMCASTTKLLLLVVQSNEVPVRQVYEMGLPLLLTNAVLADDNHALVGPIGDLLELMYALLYDHLAQLRSRVASDLSNTALFAQHHPEFVRCVPRLAVLCATKRCPDDNDDVPACADKASRTSLKAKRALSLKDFDLKGLIGTGMIGHVYIAQYKLSRQYFVIKSMWKADVIDRNMLRHVQSEKQAMETLQHPFLVKYFATFQSSDQIHFVLEYVPGGELFKWYEERRDMECMAHVVCFLDRLHEYHRFYDHEAKFFAAELVLVLAFVHDEGYIYRDLKPENIVLDAHGHIRLVDCGFAKYVGNPEDNGRCTTSLGTPQYLAPEQLRKNDRCYTQAVDWWAFGCVVFELLMGRTPFFRSATDTPYELYTRVVQGKLTFGDRFTPNAKGTMPR
ncbi:hypothetical protein DYB32_003991, partial [Aphanomyces invadans]